MPRHIHIPVKNGYATFGKQPSKEELEAVNKLAEAAFIAIPQLQENDKRKSCQDTDQCFGVQCENCELNTTK